MSRIRLVHRIILVAALVVGLLLASTLRPAPAAADAAETAIIVSAAFAGYLVLVLGITLIIYYQRENKRPRPSIARDPYSFTSSRPHPATWTGGVHFGSKCAAHGPGTLFCW